MVLNMRVRPNVTLATAVLDGTVVGWNSASGDSMGGLFQAER
jgi:hypothetical protein